MIIIKICGGGVLYNIPIIKWKKTSHIFIIITIYDWEEIALQLEKEGLELGKDYLPWYVFEDLCYTSLYHLRKEFLDGKYLNKEWEYKMFLPDKKLAVIYGNCQTAVYGNALALNREFRQEYIIINIPQVWEYNLEPEMVKFFLNDKNFWKLIKLFIYQYVSKENAFFEELASENCMRKLEDDCQKVSIVSLDFCGYFPQIESDLNDYVFGFRDKYIDELIKQHKEPDEIIDILSETQFISDEEIENCVENALFSLKKRDRFADVKIYDYIEKNYIKEQLFYSRLHPCDSLLKEYAQRIFKYLGLYWDISDEYFAGVCSHGMMRGLDMAIYPSVVRKLGLKRYENRFYFNREYVSPKMILDFKQYIELYIKYAAYQAEFIECIKN